MKLATVLATTCGACAAVLTLLSRYFALVDTRASDFDRDVARQFYNRLWTRLVLSSWMNIPIILAAQFSRLRGGIIDKFKWARYGKLVGYVDRIGLYSGSLGGFYVVSLVNGHVAAVFYAIITCPYALGVLLDHVFYHRLHGVLRSRFGSYLVTANFWGLSWMTFDLLSSLTNDSVVDAFVLVLLFTPSTWVLAARWCDMFNGPFVRFSKQTSEIEKLNKHFRHVNSGLARLDDGTVVQFMGGREIYREKRLAEGLSRQDLLGAAIAFSVAVTVGAVALGQLTAPHSPHALSLGLIAFNTVGDSLTIIITILLLKAAVEEKISLVEALTADVIMAGIIAVIAFHYGTLGSPYSLAFRSVWRLMLGQIPSGGAWQLGSFFWLIHTTFLPIAIYFSLIFLALFLRGGMKVVALFVRREFWEKPHNVTSAILAFWAAIFALAAVVIGIFR